MVPRVSKNKKGILSILVMLPRTILMAIPKAEKMNGYVLRFNQIHTPFIKIIISTKLYDINERMYN